MRILVAAASFSDKISGLQRHALNLAQCLLASPELERVHFVVAPWQREMIERSSLQSDARFVLHVAEMERSSVARNSWYYRKLPEVARAVRADLVQLSFPMPVDSSAFRCPIVVTLHDLYPYEIPMNFGFPKFIFNQITLRQCLGAVNAIACVSEATKAKLQKHLPSFSGKAVRIYNCVEPWRSEEFTRPSGIASDTPFLLCVAQHRKNKNLPLLIRAFKTLLESSHLYATMRLLIVGIHGPETERIQRLISRLSLHERVQLRVGLSEAELHWCYRNCEALVSPSITEGFGLPVAEATLAGCRVICSEIPAHWEIAAGRCRFVNLRYDGQEKLAEAIAATLREPRPRPVSLPELSLRKIRQQYLELYDSLISSASETSVSATMPMVGSESRAL